ncbi:hypothetical protein FHX70_001045 [Slackia isoflavoniconvertens]|nr:hypothetical protein [Slackia isoflavoniconvertens]
MSIIGSSAILAAFSTASGLSPMQYRRSLGLVA